MTYDQDIAVRFKQQFPCCGELDSSGTCCAPACAFGEVMNALGKLKYIRAQSESALRGEQEPKSVLRVIKMNCDHALAAHSPKGADTQREAEGRSQPKSGSVYHGPIPGPDTPQAQAIHHKPSDPHLQRLIEAAEELIEQIDDAEACRTGANQHLVLAAEKRLRQALKPYRIEP